jgi:uncharacterized MAPEG superfamily protein
MSDKRRTLGALFWAVLLVAIGGGFWYASHARKEREREAFRRELRESSERIEDAACRAKRAMGQSCD